MMKEFSDIARTFETHGAWGISAALLLCLVGLYFYERREHQRKDRYIAELVRSNEKHVQDINDRLVMHALRAAESMTTFQHTIQALQQGLQQVQQLAQQILIQRGGHGS
jgi:hypothetical protein